MPITVTAAEKTVLQKTNIPPRPEALLTISSESKKPEPDVKVISDAIISDVSISAAVLQVVNSAVFRRDKAIESIQQAVMTLGFKRLIPLVKSVALKSAIGDSDKLSGFWDRASQVATACSLVAQVIGKPQLQDHAYMLGLFHNAGIPIMVLEFEEYDEIMTLAEEQGWDKVPEQERQQFGTSHTTMSALLAQKWKLPPIMVEVIYYQHDVEGLFSSGELSSLGLDLMSILKIARNATQCFVSGEQELDEWLLIQDDILAHLDLSEVDMDNVRDNIVDQLGESS